MMQGIGWDEDYNSPCCRVARKMEVSGWEPSFCRCATAFAGGGVALPSVADRCRNTSGLFLFPL